MTTPNDDWEKRLEESAFNPLQLLDGVIRDEIYFLISTEKESSFKEGQEDMLGKVRGSLETRRLIFSTDANAWYRKGSGALYTNDDRVAGIENNALDDLDDLLTHLTNQ